MRDQPTPASPLVETVDSDGAEGRPAPETLVELLFFAYRDFVGEPDRLLERYGFGRAHHRVLHFVNRNPGLTIAGLLEILDITKQSLARVLRDLVEGGFIEQRAGDEDRRKRLLHLSASGQALASELLALQTARVSRALAGIALGERAVVEHFLTELVNAPLRHGVSQLVRGLSETTERAR